jgi:hypothetical protein
MKNSRNIFVATSFSLLAVFLGVVFFLLDAGAVYADDPFLPLFYCKQSNGA